MKVLPDLPPAETTPLDREKIRLPLGLIGFPQHREIEFLYQPAQLPFLWMRLHGPSPLNFVVIEPANFFPGYEPEIFDADAEYLELASAVDAAIFNIVTLRGKDPLAATVNLIGPLIVNRRNGLAKQVVLANHGRYSARYALVESTAAVAAGF
jgi:flagellar assembly factor FliW